ncbi:MAG: hypothetical protein ACI9TV_001334 [Sulfurimonas sp.]|jgi:hypothetical protein
MLKSSFQHSMIDNNISHIVASKIFNSYTACASILIYAFFLFRVCLCNINTICYTFQPIFITYLMIETKLFEYFPILRS